MTGSSGDVGGGWPQRRPDEAELRVSDAERHQVAEVLRHAAGEGRLDIEELEQRLEAAFAAKTYGELEPLVRDLPSHDLAITAPGSARPVVQRPAGDGDPGLRQAALPASATITVAALMGEVTVVVDQYTRVVVNGVGVMGSFGEARPRVAPVLGPGSPVVRVRGLALMGAVEVVRKPRAGKGKRLSRQELRELGE